MGVDCAWGEDEVGVMSWLSIRDLSDIGYRGGFCDSLIVMASVPLNLVDNSMNGR